MVAVIADLLEQKLLPELWGYKAARLSAVAGLGLPVAPGICIQFDAASVADINPALSGWLAVHAPRRVVLRTSSTRKDTATVANAGRTISVLECPPSVSVITHVIRRQLLPDSQRWLGDDGALTVLVQEQVSCQFAGVAFFNGDRMSVEISRDLTNAVTSGDRPDAHVEVSDATAKAVYSIGSGLMPFSALTSGLKRTCLALREGFGFDVDVEWSWKTGVTTVLQVRPITPLGGGDRPW